MQLEIVSASDDEILQAVLEAQHAIALVAGTIETGLAKIINAGRKLIAKREQVDHGEWMPWLKEHVLDPREITYATARNWIKLAEFAERKGAQLDNAASVRQAYQLAGILPESESSSGGGGGGKETGNYLVHISRLERAIESQIATRPIEQWSREDKVILKQRLQPLVKLFEDLASS